MLTSQQSGNTATRDICTMDSVNKTEQGKIAHMEAAIGVQGEQLSSLGGRVEKIEGAVADTARGVQTLLSRQGGFEATRGMIPTNMIFASIALLLSLTGIGVTIVTLSASSIRADMIDDFEKHDLRFTAIEGRMAEDDIRERADVEELDHRKEEWNEQRIANATVVAQHETRLAEMEIEANYMWDWRFAFDERFGVLTQVVKQIGDDHNSVLGGHHDNIRRIALLEVQSRANTEHSKEEGHPLIQTERIKALDARMNNWNKN